MTERDIKQELEEIATAVEGDKDAGGPRVRSMRAPKEPSQVYSVRIPTDRLDQLRRLAAARGAAPTALIRDWVVERLDAETGSPAGVHPRVEVAWSVPALAVDMEMFRLTQRPVGVWKRELAAVIERTGAAHQVVD